MQAVEEEGDVVLEAGDSCGGGGPAGSEPSVGRGGVEAVGVGESGARHGRRRALDLRPDLACAPGNRRETAGRVYSSGPQVFFFFAVVLEMEICRVNSRRDLEGGRETASLFAGDAFNAPRRGGRRMEGRHGGSQAEADGSPPRVSDRWA